MRHVSSYVPSREPGCAPCLRGLPDYELMTADERRRLAERIRQTEDRPVSRCWRVSWKWGAKWSFTDDDVAGG